MQVHFIWGSGGRVLIQYMNTPCIQIVLNCINKYFICRSLWVPTLSKKVILSFFYLRYEISHDNGQINFTTIRQEPDWLPSTLAHIKLNDKKGAHGGGGGGGGVLEKKKVFSRCLRRCESSRVYNELNCFHLVHSLPLRARTSQKTQRRWCMRRFVCMWPRSLRWRRRSPPYDRKGMTWRSRLKDSSNEYPNSRTNSEGKQNGKVRCVRVYSVTSNALI